MISSHLAEAEDLAKRTDIEDDVARAKAIQLLSHEVHDLPDLDTYDRALDAFGDINRLFRKFSWRNR
jgi:hypothetical protein